ncbi:uncharacterized protein LOC113745020 isoform X1 [Larimichthys crocea]|uniref:uncharacterized protein LOC113745020 isoform X1 n=1 Tax=Larimichthys crocea TaxID=215358 RepID=UPI000F602986|nr:uncharacterized protein LOC113745020 isoform X1 [Larimichthys crocea]
MLQLEHDKFKLNAELLLPKVSEKDPESFFSLFERVAEVRNWPESARTLMLQCVLTGRAQEAYAALNDTESKSYSAVKSAVLRAYELVPEAYRQRFRTWKKGENQSHLEFVRDLNLHFTRWYSASDVNDFEGLCELMVLEQFKSSIPVQVATYISEQKAKNAGEAAALADEYVLTHRLECRAAYDIGEGGAVGGVGSFSRQVKTFTVGGRRNGGLREQGEAKLAVRPVLPIQGISVILGNDLVGARETDFPEAFTACAVTRAMAALKTESATQSDKENGCQKFSLPLSDFPLSISRSDLVAEQQADSSLKGLMEQVRSESEVQDGACGYFLQDSLLAPPTSPGCLMVFGFLCSYGTQHLTSTHFHSCIHAPSPLID